MAARARNVAKSRWMGVGAGDTTSAILQRVEGLVPPPQAHDTSPRHRGSFRDALKSQTRAAIAHDPDGVMAMLPPSLLRLVAQLNATDAAREHAADEAATLGEDWEADAGGNDEMSEDQLYDCLFELADMWCTGISAEEYATFLRKLFKRVTVKSVTKSNGAVTVAAPKPPSSKRQQEYRTFQQSRRSKIGGGSMLGAEAEAPSSHDALSLFCGHRLCGGANVTMR